MPYIEQLFIGAADGLDQDAFERQLYVIRKSAASPLRVDESLKQRTMLYACSLSSRTIIYKGMLACEQVLPFYGDLTDPEYETHLAMVHSRFATNTFPTWERSQPLRCLSHNGEINTLRGNKNAMHSRQGVVEGKLFGDDLRKLFPVAEPGLSDSGTLDNVLEFLYMNGRTMAEAAMLMIPEAWQRHEDMPQVKRDFYEYHSCLMEPWDGPASIAFTDGTVIGAVLDRNGLRPSRYYLTHDDRVIMASEVGVLPVPPEMVKHKGRLKPGRMFLIDFEQGRMIPDAELKNDIASQRPYGEWLNEQRLKLTELPVNDDAHGFDPETDRDDAVHVAADDRAEARSGRVHGQRLGPRGPERSTAPVVRLLQTALCAGHQPADRLDPRGSDHGRGMLHRAGEEPAHDDPGARPSASYSAPHPHQ
jgi:glutamate synthase (NADPH/NADH) large chain